MFGTTATEGRLACTVKLSIVPDYRHKLEMVFANFVRNCLSDQNNSIFKEIGETAV